MPLIGLTARQHSPPDSHARPLENRREREYHSPKEVFHSKPVTLLLYLESNSEAIRGKERYWL